MANVQIPNLPSAIAFSGDEVFELVQAGTSVKGSVRQFFQAAADGLLGYPAPSATPAVTQLTSKSTGVVLEASSGQITMNAAALASGAVVEFTVTNADLTGVSFPMVGVISPGSRYEAWISAIAVGSYNVSVRNTDAISRSDALVLQVLIIG